MTLWQKFKRSMGFGKKAKQRGYSFAKMNRLTADWIMGRTGPATEVLNSLDGGRERSRDLAQNNTYIKRYLSISERNTIGSKGIKAKLGEMDADSGMAILKAWKKWGRVRSCTVCREHSWRDVQNLAVRYMKRDGELFVRMVRGTQFNDFGFALQLIEPDFIDTDLNADPFGRGRKVIMGIEKDREWNFTTAYYVLTAHPNDSVADVGSMNGRNYIRIPADEMIALGRTERIGETRHMPATHASAVLLKQLQGYEEAEVVAARVGATKGGFYKPGDSYNADEELSDGSFIQELSPGTFELLPPDVEFQSYDPTHPAVTFADFRKAMVQGIGSGLDVTYNKLANDYEGVTYSSIRSAELDERDAWMCDQEFLAEHLHALVFERWIETALLMGAVQGVSFTRLDEIIESVTWHGRRWIWVDPRNDTMANKIAVEEGWKSNTGVAAEYDSDYADNAKDREREAQIDAETVPTTAKIKLEIEAGEAEVVLDPDETGDDDGRSRIAADSLRAISA